MIIDGTNLILGRVATFAAKRALEGESVILVNCEKIIMTGKKKSLLDDKKYSESIGHPFHGPFTAKMPDRIVRRVIRGMLPYQYGRGKKAYRRIKCFMGIPKEYKTQKLETVKNADASKLNTLKFITINDIAKIYGKDYHQ